MIKKLILFLSFIVGITFLSNIYAQCTSANISSLTSTATNSCGNNGTITVNYTTTDGTIQLHLFDSSGNIVNSVNGTSGTNSYTWSATGTPNTQIHPGTYTVKLVCGNVQSTIYATQTVTVAGTYQSMAVSPVVSNLCNDFLPGGTFSLNVTGGSGPYKIVLTKPDNSTITVNSVTSFPYIFNKATQTNQFGSYKYTITDACGNTVSDTYSINPTVAKLQEFWMPKTNCNGTVSAVHWYSVTNTGGSAPIAAPGIKMVVHTGSFTGPIIYNGTFSQSTGFSPAFVYTPPADHQYYIVATSACGETYQYTHSLTASSDYPDYPVVSYTTSTVGCGASETMCINFKAGYFWNFPITITAVGQTNNQTYTLTTSANNDKLCNLPLKAYNVTVTDSCNPKNTYTLTVPNPKLDTTTPTPSYNPQNWRCTAGPTIKTGSIGIDLFLSGYLPNRAGATVTIIQAPDSGDVGKVGIMLPDGSWTFSNLIPGNYVVRYDAGTGCNFTKDFTFTITNGYLLIQSLVSTPQSNCSGFGSITSTVNTNTSHPYVVQLLNSSGVVIDSNTSGNFTNLAPGTYTTRLYVDPVCVSGNSDAYVPTSTINTVTITNGTTGAQITAHTSVICTDGAGNPLTTGTLYLDVAGTPNMTLEYSLNGTTYFTPSIATGNSPINYPVTTSSFSTYISGLPANQTIYVRVTDNCGSKIQQFTVGTLSNIQTNSASQPCNGNPYALSMPYYSGATYQILNPSGAVVSNTRFYTIPNYTPSYNGIYTIKITWGTCYTRLVYVYLNSALCGQPIDEVCFKDPGTANPAIPVNHGITALGRAGAEAENWPMVRTGAHTVLEAQTKGFVINRMTSATSGTYIGEPLDAANNPAITNPTIGMMFYDKTKDCLSINTNASRSGWKCYKTPACPTY